MDRRDEIFVSRANALLEKYESLYAQSEDVMSLITERDKFKPIINDMIHLMYSYDPGLPALEPFKRGVDYVSDFSKVLDCLRYLIHYAYDIKL